MRTMLLVLISSFLLVSCDSGTDAPNTNGRVTAGSQFTFSTARYDSLGNVIAGTESTYIANIEKTGQTLLGKSNVVTWRSNIDTTAGYFAYDEQGDIWSYEDYYVTFGQTAPMWIRYPVTSKQTLTLPPIDETSGNNHYTWNGTIDHDGTEPITISGKVFECERIKRVETGSQTGSSPRLFHEDRHYWYSKELGFFVKFKLTSIDRDTNNNPVGFYESVTQLTSYTLK